MKERKNEKQHTQMKKRVLTKRKVKLIHLYTPKKKEECAGRGNKNTTDH